MDPIDLKGLEAEQRRRLVLAAGLSAAAFVIALLAGGLSGSEALKADSLDFAATTLMIGLSFGLPRLPAELRAMEILA